MSQIKTPPSQTTIPNCNISQIKTPLSQTTISNCDMLWFEREVS